MVICLERGADLHMSQLMPLSLTVSCFSEIQIVFTFLVPSDPGSDRKRTVKRVCVCVCAQSLIKKRLTVHCKLGGLKLKAVLKRYLVCFPEAMRESR